MNSLFIHTPTRGFGDPSLVLHHQVQGEGKL